MIKTFAIIAAVIPTIGLLHSFSAAPAHAEYVKGSVTEAQRVEAHCNMVAGGAQRGYFAMGSSSYVAGAALGNAIGNLVAVSEAKRNCMAMNGFVWKEPKRAAVAESMPGAMRKQKPGRLPNDN